MHIQKTKQTDNHEKILISHPLHCAAAFIPDRLCGCGQRKAISLRLCPRNDGLRRGAGNRQLHALLGHHLGRRACLERRGYETCSASVGGIYDNRMLVKPTKSAVVYMPTADRELPYDGAKEMLLVEGVDNREFLNGLFNAMYDDLPAPKKKK